MTDSFKVHSIREEISEIKTHFATLDAQVNKHFSEIKTSLSDIAEILEAIRDKGIDLLKFILKGAFIIALIAMGVKEASKWLE